jgi:hypothetical protein
VGTGGSYPITIAASNGVVPSASQSVTLTVDEAPSITSAEGATFGAGVAGTFTVTTAGYPVAALTETGAVPLGVLFTDNSDGTATISGTALIAGSYPLTVTASSGIGSPATQSFVLTVSTAPQAITFTSTPPGTPVVGQTYAVSATGGDSGNPVTFSIDASSAAVCSISGSTVTFEHPGVCTIDAAQAGTAQYAPGSGTQPATVTKATTHLALAVQAHAVVATVTAVAPGAGTPSGGVTFSVDGTPVGTAVLGGGTATLNYTVAAGKLHNVSAAYAGDGDFVGSSASTARQDPSITATLSSAHAKTRYGWYRSPVKVTFHCTTHGAPLTAPCPAAVTLGHNGAGQSVTRAISATDGGIATITVRSINIDTVAPSVSIAGVRRGAIYAGAAPHPRCVAHDALSRVASCTLRQSTRGITVTVRATATDRAGNTRTATLHYSLLRFYVQGVTPRNGVYPLREGHSYTLVALTSGGARPRFYDAAPRGRTPRPADHYFHAAGRQGGLHRYVLVVRIDRGLGRYKYWSLGIKVGRTMHVLEFHPKR